MDAWYQCRICDAVCSSKKGVMSTHEKKHGKRSLQKLNALNSSTEGEGISSIWRVAELDTNGGNMLQDLLRHKVQEDQGLKLTRLHGNVVDIKRNLPCPEFDDYGPPILSPYSPTAQSIPSPQSPPTRKIGRGRPRTRPAKVKTWKPNKLNLPKGEGTGTTSTTNPSNIRRSSRPTSKSQPPPNVTPLPRNSKNAKTNLGKNRQQGTVDSTTTDNLLSPTTSGEILHEDNGVSAGKVCSICGYIGRGEWEVQAHMTTHTKEKPFQCSACDSKFVRSQNMRHHMRFNCPEAERLGLAEKFRKKAADYVEKRKAKASMPTSDSSPELHQCPNCDEKFSKSVLLKNHSRVHNVGANGAVYTCCFCKGDFYSNKSATDHMARIHNMQMETQHKCQYCGKYLSTRLSLRRHIYLSHKAESDTLSDSLRQFKTPSSSLHLVDGSVQNVSNPSGPFSKKGNSVGNTRSNKISVAQKDDPDIEWMGTPKIVKVEHITGPLPQNNFIHNQSNSRALNKNWSKSREVPGKNTTLRTYSRANLGSSTFQQNKFSSDQPISLGRILIKHDFREQQQFLNSEELYEPEMEIGLGDDNCVTGNDPLAF